MSRAEEAHAGFLAGALYQSPAKWYCHPSVFQIMARLVIEVGLELCAQEDGDAPRDEVG